MSGQSVITTVGKDGIAAMLRQHMIKFRFGEGGYSMSSLVTETIDPSGSGVQKVYTGYVISGGDFPISTVIQISKKFTIAGDHVSLFEVGAVVKVMESTGNDGKYTVASAAYVGSETEITVNEAIPDSTADGIIYVDKLPICKGPTGGLFHHSLAVVEYNGATIVQKLEDLSGIGTLEQTLGGSTGTGTVNYKTGQLDFEFENYVGVGHTVVVEYKYANAPLVPVAGQTGLYSQSDSSMYTFEKDFEASNLTLRGPGYATLRCTMLVTEAEGIDDGMSYGGTPYYFEGGVFDEDDTLICYFTFNKERKTGSVTMTHKVDFVV